MPQSSEHLDALVALGVGTACSSSPAPTWPTRRIPSTVPPGPLAGTPLSGIPAVAVSAAPARASTSSAPPSTSSSAACPRRRAGRSGCGSTGRSRSRGAGTVVTGTLAAGRIRVGDALELAGPDARGRGPRPAPPRGRPPRSPRSLGSPSTCAASSRRRRAPRRGPAHARGPGCHASVVDVELSGSSGPTSAARDLVLHVGSAAGRCTGPAVGRSGPVHRLHLGRALPLRPGDRGLLRDPAAQRRRRPPGPGRRSALAAAQRRGPPPGRRAATAAARPGRRGSPPRRGVTRSALDFARHARRRSAVADPDFAGVGDLVVAEEDWARWLAGCRTGGPDRRRPRRTGCRRGRRRT